MYKLEKDINQFNVSLPFDKLNNCTDKSEDNLYEKQFIDYSESS